MTILNQSKVNGTGNGYGQIILPLSEFRGRIVVQKEAIKPS